MEFRFSSQELGESCLFLSGLQFDKAISSLNAEGANTESDLGWRSGRHNPPVPSLGDSASLELSVTDSVADKNAAVFSAHTFVAAYDVQPDQSRYLVVRGTYTLDVSGSKQTSKNAVCKIAWCQPQAARPKRAAHRVVDDSDTEFDLVSKFQAENDTLLALRREAGYYEGPLKKFQGKGVPELYGYYEADVARDSSQQQSNTEVVCLIFSDCGVAVSEQVMEENPSIQDGIMDLLLSLHEGHVDFASNWAPPDGVVQNQDSGALCLVGFSRATVTHRCHDIDLAREMFTRYRIDRFRVPKSFGCVSLYEIARSMHWLTPGEIYVEPWSFSVFEFYTATEMINSLENDFPGSMKNDEELKEYLDAAIEQYRQNYENRLSYVVAADEELAGRWPPVVA